MATAKIEGEEEVVSLLVWTISLCLHGRLQVSFQAQFSLSMARPSLLETRMAE